MTPEENPAPDLPTPALIEHEEPPQAPEMSTEAISADESKARTWMRAALRWLIGFFIIFLLGMVAAYVAFYRPASAQLHLARADLAAAQTEIDSLETQIATLDIEVTRLTTLQTTNETLTAALARANLHVAVLSALADVRGALTSLARQDPATARVQLASTPATLESLASLLEANQKPVIEAMQARLELALGEMDADPFAAESDLEVLLNSLITLENSYFKTP